MMSMSDGEPIEWEDTMDMMNSTSNTDTLEWQLIDEKTEKANEAIDDWDFKQGDLVKIRITNPDDTMHPMQHPIHIHGQRFLVLSTDGEFSDNLVWKDTTLIPAGSTVELLVEMSNPGEWMLHCHIPEHLESGMMAEFNVSNL
jgi:FtsP/CotA-like multicopper oxidase with cupredoxin domain